MSTFRRPQLPPRSLLVGAAAVAALAVIPYLATRFLAPPAGSAYVPAPLAARDWLAYVALTHEPWAAGETFLANPFTTEPQGGRFILLFLQLLNSIHHLTGVSGFVLLEAARLPLLLVFLLALWSFLGKVLPGERERRWAAWLVLLSGGWEFALWALRGHLPPAAARVVEANLWHMFGWNTFASARNPLWLVGFTLLLVTLPRAIAPGPASWRSAAAAAAALVGAWCTHPYSAVAVAAMVAGAWALEWLLGARRPWSGRGPMLACLAVAGVILGALVAWQHADPVFRASSDSFFGPKAASPFWYPLTFGALFPLALAGARRLGADQNPWRHALGGATLALVLLSSSDLVNGYHFVPYLHVLVCVFAAPALTATLDALRARRAGVALSALLVVALFASAPAVVAGGISDRQESLVPADALAAAARLGTLPPGNVLAPAWMGNLVPAYGPHRVYVGHYFMTPRYPERRVRVDRILDDPAGNRADLLRLVEDARIDYALVPADRAQAVAEALGPAHGGGAVVGSWAILLVRRGPGAGPVSPARTP